MLEGLEAFCGRALARYGCPSVSVGVAERGEVALAAAFGVADRATGRPATPGTVYGLGSVTKPVVAIAVCVAADAGLLDLDAPVPFDFGLSAPTVRQLLGHRAGFAPYYDFGYADEAARVDAARHTVQFEEAGSGFTYANLGYRVLGHLLEAAGGQEAGAFVRERVFEPLGLTSWHLGPAHPGPAPAAVRYTPDGRAYPPYTCGHPAATLGWATAGELALFTAAYERLLRPATAAAVLTAEPITAHTGYGLGWTVSSGDGPLVISHSGGGPGVAAMTVGVPERELAVSVLCDCTDKSARDAVVRYVLDELLDGFDPAALASPVLDPARPLDLPEGRWSGSISTPEGELPVTLEVLPGRRVTVTLPGAGTGTVPATASATRDLRADTALQLPTADARINSPSLAFALTLRDGALTGLAHAYKDGDHEGRLGNFLSHRCVLRTD
ncbi:serine hydrolase domain-containing protein [Streptantibioticus silvisoli]|uniref:Serine hydrolase domain-containing protein n=1 Tax=Streptantibioticus silvisoli TaxID=2705255 RepID=A0ABT6VT66_9ACTN|nr:serine hydrolase domain-containing protein [Streptantibioticus silvisoli]MDI5961672.1 serine hydrolase domain-containing protein [Streptantibioticus silvisoli]